MRMPVSRIQCAPVSAVTARPCDAGRTIRLRRWRERRERLLAFRDRLAVLASADLPAQDALNRTLLADRVDTALAGLAFDEERIPFISGDGFYTTADYAALGTTLTSEDDAEAWLARLAAIPAYYATETANMARGIRTGFTQPRMTVERAIQDVRAQAEQPSADSPLLAPFETFPAASRRSERSELARACARDDRDARQAGATRVAALPRAGLPACGAHGASARRACPTVRRTTPTSCDGTRRRR